jgi:hypothetical protein
MGPGPRDGPPPACCPGCAAPEAWAMTRTRTLRVDRIACTGRGLSGVCGRRP